MQLLYASAGTGRCMQCLWIRQSKQPDAAILSARGNLPEAALLHGMRSGGGRFWNYLSGLGSDPVHTGCHQRILSQRICTKKPGAVSFSGKPC